MNPGNNFICCGIKFLGTTIDVADSIRKAAIFLRDDNHMARPPIDGEDIAIYGEKDALAVFLEYAKGCLLVASATTSKLEQSNMIQIAMSVLLPVVSTQSRNGLITPSLNLRANTRDTDPVQCSRCSPGFTTRSSYGIPVRTRGLDEWRTLVPNWNTSPSFMTQCANCECVLLN